MKLTIALRRDYFIAGFSEPIACAGEVVKAQFSGRGYPDRVQFSPPAAREYEFSALNRSGRPHRQDRRGQLMPRDLFPKRGSKKNPPCTCGHAKLNHFDDARGTGCRFVACKCEQFTSIFAVTEKAS